jgi:hypothetical protein
LDNAGLELSYHYVLLQNLIRPDFGLGLVGGVAVAEIPHKKLRLPSRLEMEQ